LGRSIRDEDKIIMKQLLFGRNPVKEWLSAGLPVGRLMIAQDSSGPGIQDIRDLASRKNIRVETVARAQLFKLVRHDGHQGVAAEIDLPAYVDVEDILEMAREKQEPPLIAILDGVQDPHNLGAILRSADGAGIHGVVIPRDKSVGLTPAVFKASAGAASHVPLAQVTNLATTMEFLKEKGMWLIGADEESRQEYFNADFKGPVGIVLGSEGRGLRRLVRDKCDFLVSIPMHGKVNSLNVSVAAGLLFFQARRQRMS
jgi:23S rRNA (guanosine2251-2'-O)-methyltransferase